MKFVRIKLYILWCNMYAIIILDLGRKHPKDFMIIVLLVSDDVI